MDLFEAVRTGDIQRVNELLDFGIDVNSKKQGQPALIYGSNPNFNKCSLEMIKLLLDRGADINLEDDDGLTLLMYESSSKIDSLETVKLLLDRGADISLKDNHGWSALMFACEYASLETIKLLLDRGADDYTKALKCVISSRKIEI